MTLIVPIIRSTWQGAVGRFVVVRVRTITFFLWSRTLASCRTTDVQFSIPRQTSHTLNKTMYHVAIVTVSQRAHGLTDDNALSVINDVTSHDSAAFGTLYKHSISVSSVVRNLPTASALASQRPPPMIEPMLNSFTYWHCLILLGWLFPHLLDDSGSSLATSCSGTSSIK